MKGIIIETKLKTEDAEKFGKGVSPFRKEYQLITGLNEEFGEELFNFCQIFEATPVNLWKGTYKNIHLFVGYKNGKELNLKEGKTMFRIRTVLQKNYAHISEEIDIDLRSVELWRAVKIT